MEGHKNSKKVRTNSVVQEDNNVVRKGKGTPQIINQEELNDLIRDLGLPKDKSELMVSVFKKKNILSDNVQPSFHRD